MLQGMVEQRVRAIAVGAALVAVALAIAATVVVLQRRAPVAASAPPIAVDGHVPAAQLVELRGNAVIAAPSGEGVTVADAALRKALGLDDNDLISAISGRPVKREFDVYDAILGVAQLGATAMYVEILRDGHPQLLHWSIDGDLNKARRAARAAIVPPTPLPRPVPRFDPFAARGGAAPDPVLDTVETVDETHAEMPRATLQRLLDDPSLVSTSARVVPSVRNGDADGFKLYAIRPGSFYAKLNLQNGDTIRAVNGYELTSADRALEVFNRLGSATTVTVDVVRRGQPVILTISIK